MSQRDASTQDVTLSLRGEIEFIIADRVAKSFVQLTLERSLMCQVYQMVLQKGSVIHVMTCTHPAQNIMCGGTCFC